MVVDAFSFRRASIADLELSFHQSLKDADILLALEAELGRPSTPRARELRGRVRQALASRSRVAETVTASPKPWYRRRGIVFSVFGVVAAGIAQGVCHAIGFHVFEPVWGVLQHLVGVAAE